MTRILLVSFILSAFINVSSSLEESIVDDAIVKTEAAIRNTTNKLFAALKLKRDNPKLSEYLVLNKYFASLTLRDHDSLNKIVKITRNNVENNSSSVFIAAINELLDGDIQEDEKNKTLNNVPTEDYVVEIIKTFLSTLRNAKELYETNSYVNINEDILKLFREANYSNATYEGLKGDQSLGDDQSGEFWKPSGRRIYKGERTKIKHFPFMASIQIFNNFQCAGSVIKSDLIITASSCLELAWNNRFYRENPAFLSVRVGSSFYNGGGEVIPVLEIYFHPSYNPKTLKNNICILRLARRINFRWRSRRKVRKIEIDRNDHNIPYNTPGVTILGWGAKGRSNIVRDPWQNILSYAVLDVYPLNDCQDVYSKNYVTHKNFCAGFMSKGGGACNHDVGGPGIDGGILMGVVSFGSPVCGAVDAPTVFTKLGYYADWIDDIMAQEVPYSKKRTTRQTKRTTQVPLKHNLRKPTTFKIPPPSGGKMRPIPINEEESYLRMLDDGLFKEFLETMFNKKDVAEYLNAFSEAKQSIEGATKKQYEEEITQESQETTPSYTDFYTARTTKLIKYEEDYTEETTNEPDYSGKYTILEDGMNSDNNENIPDFLNDIDLKRIIEQDLLSGTETTKGKSVTKSVFFEDIDSPNKENESVLTLLYLSDEYKDQDGDFEKIEYKDEVNSLSIPIDNFENLTRSKDKQKNPYSVLPEKELYEILSEAIDDEMRFNKTK